eukprot:6171676-Amphidinium_carterae.1
MSASALHHRKGRRSQSSSPSILKGKGSQSLSLAILRGRTSQRLLPRNLQGDNLSPSNLEGKDQPELIPRQSCP